MSAQTAPAATPAPADNNPSSTTTTTTTTTTTGQPPAPDQSVITLSPFEVNASHDQGYFAANTLAGTRLNTNIADLASSVTVVTKQQMRDTNSLNINDVMRFESNTEGALTYTPIATFRGQVEDTLQGTGATGGAYTSALASGNRVRGLAAADNEVNNFWAISRIPMDGYDVESVEIDRGPNSIIFGSGSPAGIFNTSLTEASVTKSSGEIDLMADQWGTIRESIDFNAPLINNRLAIDVAQMYQSEQFEQKPSSDLTRRQYATLTFQPWGNSVTRIKASFENYSNYNADPNFVTPIDYVTPWIDAGRPVWNTLTDQVTYLATGKTSLPYALTTTMPNYVAGGPVGNTALTSTTSPFFVPGLTFGSATHNILFIDQGQTQAFFRGQQTGFSNTSYVPKTLSASQALVEEERLTTSTPMPQPTYLANGNPLYAVWQIPTVSSKSIYNWKTVNTESLDYTQTKAKTYNVDLQQALLPEGTPWGNLNLDVAWFRQELTQFINSPESQAPATTMYIDTNQYLPDGTVNPHLGQPYVDIYASDLYQEPEINNNWRAMLDYDVDPSKHVPSWLQWIGHHRFVTSFLQHDDIQTNLRYRPGIYGGDPLYLPLAATLNASTGYGYSNNNTAIERVVYLGTPTGSTLGHANGGPGFINYYTQPQTNNISTYNYASNSWVSSQVLSQADLFPSGGISENLQDSKTYFWQPYLWDDRIVGILGIDDDQVKNRNTVFPATNPLATEYTNGFSNRSVWFDEGPWNYVGGNTSTMGVVLHPFKDWAMLDRPADNGNLAAEFLRTISFTYNKSNNFNPPTTYNTDFFGNTLPIATGSDKDYGIEIATPDNKLFLRATWWKTTDLNQVYVSTIGNRALYIDQTLLKDWATKVVEVRDGQDPTSANFGNTNVFPITATMQTQIAALTGLPYNFGGVGEKGEYINPAETENGVGKGIDLELEYNPLPNWTMKFTWGKQLTSVDNASNEAVAWFNHRSPAWLTYTAPDLNKVYTKSDGTPLSLANFWSAYGYDTAVTGPGNVSGYTSTQAYYNIVVATALATDTATNGTLASNQREYSWNYLTNYNFDRGILKGLGIGTALQYDGRANVGYYGSTSNLNGYGQIAYPDINRPIYTPAKFHINLWTSYQYKLPWSHLTAKVQFNIQDLTSNGYLLPITYNFDGTPAAERIIPPRLYQLTTSVYF
ncbi:MAG TPA: TonB-dependent receptor [Opitutaceae bacterium]